MNGDVPATLGMGGWLLYSAIGHILRRKPREMFLWPLHVIIIVAFWGVLPVWLLEIHEPPWAVAGLCVAALFPFVMTTHAVIKAERQKRSENSPKGTADNSPVL